MPLSVLSQLLKTEEQKCGFEGKTNKVLILSFVTNERIK